jgi:predicted amidohydrolase
VNSKILKAGKLLTSLTHAFSVFTIYVQIVWAKNALEERRCIDDAGSIQYTDRCLESRIKYRFWGGSEIINPYGKQIYQGAFYEEDEIVGEISKDLLRRKKIILPYLRDDDPYFTYRELEPILFI